MPLTPLAILFCRQYKWRVRPTRPYFESAFSTVRAPTVSAHSLQGTIPSLEPRARVITRSHKPVNSTEIPPDPESRENPTIRAKTATHKGKPLGIISKGSIVPVHQHQRVQKPISSASAPCYSATVLGVLYNLNGKITPTNIQGWQPLTKQPTTYLPSIFITSTFLYWNYIQPEWE